MILDYKTSKKDFLCTLKQKKMAIFSRFAIVYISMYIFMYISHASEEILFISLSTLDYLDNYTCLKKSMYAEDFIIWKHYLFSTNLIDYFHKHHNRHF
jgi:hypothetical protein